MNPENFHKTSSQPPFLIEIFALLVILIIVIFLENPSPNLKKLLFFQILLFFPTCLIFHNWILRIKKVTIVFARFHIYKSNILYLSIKLDC